MFGSPRRSFYWLDEKNAVFVSKKLFTGTGCMLLNTVSVTIRIEKYILGTLKNQQ